MRTLMGCRPTAWHSAAASALHRITSKTNDLGREAVCCNAGLGGPAGCALDRPPATKALPRRPIVPNDEACGDHTRHWPDVQSCRATRHGAATRGICHMTERAERRGMELPRAAP